MSETYYSGYDSDRGRKPRRSLLLRLLDLLMTLLTAVTAVTMVVTFFVPYVDPGRVWFFPVLGLAAPAVYVVTVVLALYWIIRWRLVRAGIMVALVVVGLFKVSLFYRPEFRRNYGDERYHRRAFKVMTYNVRGFYGENGLSSVGDVLQLIGGAVRRVRIAGREVRKRCFRTYAGARFALRRAAGDPEQIPHPALRRRTDPRHLGLGRSADRRRYDPGVQQPPAFDGDQGGRQRLPHQPRISLRYGARGQTAEHGGPFPREQRAACRAGGQHRGASSAATSTIRPCRTFTAPWPRD